jgi:phosphatidylglycerol:prolipoprotein diacylglycerol transferase
MFLLNPVALDLGFVNITWYALFIMSGVGLALWFAIRQGKKVNIDQEFMIDLVTFGLPISIIGARIYYVVFNLDYYLANPVKIVMINEGGIAIHGAIFSAFIWGYFFSKKKGHNFLDVADIGAMGFMIAQALGRWGNFMNQEAYGGVVSRSFLEGLKLPEFIIEGMYIRGEYHHPTFLYESIWNIVGFLVIYFVISKRDWIKKGDIALLYFIYYSIGRFFTEWLRTMGDPQDALRFLGLPVAQLVSVLLIIGGIVLLVLKRKYKVGETNEV